MNEGADSSHRPRPGDHLTNELLLRWVAPVVGGAAVVAWRLEETRSPVTAARIVVPPIGMSMGLLMLVFPPMRVPWSWGAVAFSIGLLVLGPLLSRSSQLESREGVVWMRRSRAFAAILFGLVALRLLLHDWIGDLLSPLQTASVLFLLALGMILRWRVRLYLAYRRLALGPAATNPGGDVHAQAPRGETPREGP